MAQLILFNKPFNVVSQFSGTESDTLAAYIPVPNVYPAGRLDKDSEGLLLLTDCGRTQQHISNPRFNFAKIYWAQVEGEIDDKALRALETGLVLKDGPTRPAIARRLGEPHVWDRTPPIRERRNIPVSWLSLTITEGRNRQVRRMTAAVGFPTLRLIRHSIGPWSLESPEPDQQPGLQPGLQPGEYRRITLPPAWWTQPR